MPVLENRQKATAYTKTQLIKFGIVVRVCTIFRNHLHLISFKNTAKNSGRTDVAMFKKLMAKVFRITINS